MIFGEDRAELRKMYADAWQKHCDRLPLSALETQIVRVFESGLNDGSRGDQP